MHSHVIELPIAEIQAYCETQPIQRLSLFGSVLRADYSPKSDVDILVEFLPNARVGYFKLGEIQEVLEQLVGREVDLLTPNALSEHFRQDVLDVAQVIYEKE
jgi:predicted nucleotidyltransferase